MPLHVSLAIDVSCKAHFLHRTTITMRKLWALIAPQANTKRTDNLSDNPSAVQQRGTGRHGTTEPERRRGATAVLTGDVSFGFCYDSTPAGVSFPDAVRPPTA